MILVRALNRKQYEKPMRGPTNNKHLVCDELIKNYLFCTIYDTQTLTKP